MRKESEGVTEALLKSAENEFLKYGFHDASLRRISAESGVSTNSIYTRFGDKEGLFTALVQPAADGLMEIYMSFVSCAYKSDSITDAMDTGNQGTYGVLEYIYKNFNAFKLIFCCSAGTEYEKYFDKLAGIEEMYYKTFVKQYAKPDAELSDFFIHVICTSGWQYIYEIISHELSFETAKTVMDNVEQFRYAGWKAVLGIDFLQ